MDLSLKFPLKHLSTWPYLFFVFSFMGRCLFVDFQTFITKGDEPEQRAKRNKKEQLGWGRCFGVHHFSVCSTYNITKDIER